MVFGDGKQIRDFNYVDDVVDALLLCGLSEEANGEIFNLGAEDPMSLKDTADLLTELYEKCAYEVVPFPEDRKNIDIGDYYGDYRKTRSKLGWATKVSLRDGLKKTMKYYKDNYKYYL